MTNIINMTPHKVDVGQWNDMGELGKEFQILYTLPASGNLIRLSTKTVDAGFTLGDAEAPIPVTKTVFGTPEGLPDYQEGTFYIVSQIVKNALTDRTDLLVPAEVVRDEKGNILGCQSLGI